MSAGLEHVNITVSNPKATAAWLDAVFGWHIRWHGDAINGGRTYHVGSDANYVALYTPAKTTAPHALSYDINGGLNHVGVSVDDLAATEAKVKQAGFTPFNHADYEPGRRFYFRDTDNVEWEVVSYS